MKAIRIKPIGFGRNGQKVAVKANVHGNVKYNLATDEAELTIKVFAEDDIELETYNVLLPKEVTDLWIGDNMKLIVAALTARQIEIDTDYQEPQEPTHEEVAI